MIWSLNSTVELINHKALFNTVGVISELIKEEE